MCYVMVRIWLFGEDIHLQKTWTYLLYLCHQKEHLMSLNLYFKWLPQRKSVLNLFNEPSKGGRSLFHCSWKVLTYHRFSVCANYSFSFSHWVHFHVLCVGKLLAALPAFQSHRSNGVSLPKMLTSRLKYFIFKMNRILS